MDYISDEKIDMLRKEVDQIIEKEIKKGKRKNVIRAIRDIGIGLAFPPYILILAKRA